MSTTVVTAGIDAVKLTKHFGSKRAVDGVDLRLGGGVIGLLGPNGAGKTTLLRMVAGDLPVRVGTVARSGGLGVMRQFIGMITDSRTLNDLARELAAPPVRAAGERLAAAEALAPSFLTISVSRFATK